jgi:hypothetical protein
MWYWVSRQTRRLDPHGLRCRGWHLLWRLALSTASELTTVLSSRAALCQVYDSIFMDVPMSRVKFNVNTEYAYIQNFKVLQSKLCHAPIIQRLPGKEHY